MLKNKPETTQSASTYTNVPYTSRYRVDNGMVCIDLHIQNPLQLFDARDPAPFREKDLDEDLVRYLILSTREIPYTKPVKIVLTVPKENSQQLAHETIINALYTYFDFEIEAARNEIYQLFRQGRFALFLGLSFLLVCSSLATLIPDTSLFSFTAKEGLTIMGWVALWKPVNLYLYEWWPLRDKIKVYEKLANMDVEVRTI